VRDARFLRGGRGVDVAKDVDEILLRAIRAEGEREDADQQREKWDQREEDLVGDGAGEETAIVVGKALDDRPAASYGAS
jgi:hypothetical protein